MKKAINRIMDIGIAVEIGLILFVIGSIYTNQDWLRNILMSFL